MHLRRYKDEKAESMLRRSIAHHGIEACGTSHHWARELIRLGHEVRLMPPAYVKPSVKRGKTDAADAEAICEAVTRPPMRFVAVKSCEQQAALSMHRAGDRSRSRRFAAGRRCGTAPCNDPGIGPVGATALAAAVTDPDQFRSCRQFAAWLGLTPLQNSSGGKEKLGRISKMGDK
jgi:transposase